MNLACLYLLFVRCCVVFMHVYILYYCVVNIEVLMSHHEPPLHPTARRKNLVASGPAL